MRADVSTATSSIPAGKSHSCDLPTSSARAPSAQTISVADGRSDAMRTATTITDVTALFVRERAVESFLMRFWRALWRRGRARDPVAEIVAACKALQTEERRVFHEEDRGRELTAEALRRKLDALAS